MVFVVDRQTACRPLSALQGIRTSRLGSKVTLELTIRRANEDDAEAVSRVILAALRETNAKDYSQDIIARVEKSFSPSAVLALMRRRRVSVAVVRDRIVGTASLDGSTVRSVFVDPELQRRGIGQRLMAEVEEAAHADGVTVLAVPSSVTAEPFYAKLGFKAVRDSYHGDERTIIMERSLEEQ
ncbi:GNAT family N-acetyltransferase [Mesorhizobium sp. AR10]|uniref:GNAT family N-acetyltransferase n=1 Tax=Mesorhizobium sp. AR10 TaxID=2865839 RepID=UPI0029E7DE46|nr:GNAT family N-acetyltransferase [Mesorhizobium sp. AR10]